MSTGTLSLQGGGTIAASSTFLASSGADLDFGGGNDTAPAGSSISATGTGTVSFSGATVAVAGTYNVANTTLVSNGEVDFNASASTGALVQSYGTLGGTGTLTVSGLTTWTGGSMAGTGVTNANGGLTIGGSDNNYYSETLDGRTLDNSGAATLAINPGQGGALHFQDGATFDNKLGASFSFIADASIVNGGGSPNGGTFINDGSLAKTGGSGTSALGGSITLNNTGQSRHRPAP